MSAKEKILICGILPPPFFGHSMIYKILMESSFVDAFDITFFNMKFWSYEKHKKLTAAKLCKLIQYLFQYTFLIAVKRPRYLLYAMSFDKMPFLKDFSFCAIAKMFGCRIVLHDMGQYLPELYNSSKPFYRRLIKKFMKMVTASIVLGEVTRDAYAGFLDRPRTFAVHGSVEDSYKIPRRENSTSKNGHIDVLFFSFLSVSKGFLTALNAIPEVIKENPHIKFTFAGPFESPELEKKAASFVAEHKLEKNVKYLGYIGDDKERTTVLRNSDIFIFPTQRDVFGLVLLHAMAEGLPVIASKEGAIPEIIENNQNGYLILKKDHQELAEKILHLAREPRERERMGKANRLRYVNFYTPDKYGERMIKVFEEIRLLTNPSPDLAGPGFREVN